MPEISILHYPIMEFTVFLTILISNLRDRELFHSFHVPILTENVYWKLLKYKSILTQNMQIFMELWYGSLICVTRVAMWATFCWELDPIILLFFLFFLIIDRWPVVISSADGVKVYYIVLTLSGEVFEWICFCEPIFRTFCVDLILRDLS